MPKEIIVVLEDCSDCEPPEHYLDLLFEELVEQLEGRKLVVKQVEVREDE